jgi:hypothetical protein
MRSRDLIHSLPACSALGLPVYVPAPPAAPFSTAPSAPLEMTIRFRMKAGYCARECPTSIYRLISMSNFSYPCYPCNPWFSSSRYGKSNRLA